MASEHGTYARYVNQRCRCAACRAAKRDYARVQRARGPAEHPTECAHCGGGLPPAPTPRGGRPRRFCSDRCADAFERKDVCACGAPKRKRSLRCKSCYGQAVRAKHGELHRTVERLWAEGAKLREIAVAIGCSERSVQSQFSVWRAMGLDLPYRRSPESLERIRAGQRRWREGRAAA